MSGFLPAPTFSPPATGIPLGSGGQVLTMVGGVPRFAAAGAGGGFPGRFAYASAAGAVNDVNPGTLPNPFPGTVAFRLIITLAAGAANWTGLLAGVDGQLGWLLNNDAANQLTLNNLNAGSLAANQFQGRANADVIVPAKSSVLLLYDATLALWIIL